MHNIQTRLFTVGLGLLLALGQAYGAPETHDGFYLRMHVGPGSTSAISDGDPKSTIEGSGGGAGLSLGYMIYENTGLFFEFSTSTMIGPTFESDGMVDRASDEIQVAISGGGIGIIHYFMPVNVYVSAALVSDRLSIRVLDFDNAGNDFMLAESDPGKGLSFMVGKEWWVSDDWGLGLAGAFRSSTVNDESEEWAVNAFNLVFSATYN